MAEKLITGRFDLKGGLYVPGSNGHEHNGNGNGLVTPNNGNLLRPGVTDLYTPKLEVLKHPEAAFLKIETINPFAKAVDMRPLLNEHYPGWQSTVVEVAKGAAQKEIKGGSVATSMEPGDHVTYYQPTNGEAIQKELPWFFDLFNREIRHLAARATGDNSLYLGKDYASSLNINYLTEGDYEKHIDRNPITALLALETLEHGEGGELILHERRDPQTNRPVGDSHALRPIAGLVYIFDGFTHPHEVTELTRKKPRLVAAGDYYNNTHPEVVDVAFNKNIGVAAQ
jgi:hypothetical protein